jgi:hypothetical protein
VIPRALALPGTPPSRPDDFCGLEDLVEVIAV